MALPLSVESWRAPTLRRRAASEGDSSSSKSNCRAGSWSVSKSWNQIAFLTRRHGDLGRGGKRDKASPPCRLTSLFSASLASLAPRCLASSRASSARSRLATSLFNSPKSPTMGCAECTVPAPQRCSNFLLKAFLDRSRGGTRSTFTVKARCASTGSASLCDESPLVRYQCRRCMNRW